MLTTQVWSPLAKQLSKHFNISVATKSVWTSEYVWAEGASFLLSVVQIESTSTGSTLFSVNTYLNNAVDCKLGTNIILRFQRTNRCHQTSYLVWPTVCAVHCMGKVVRSQICHIPINHHHSAFSSLIYYFLNWQWMLPLNSEHKRGAVELGDLVDIPQH